jgi:hypothetical protein
MGVNSPNLVALIEAQLKLTFSRERQQEDKKTEKSF